MENIFSAIHGSYGSHCGITDLYPEHAAVLRAAILSGEDFKASWGSKKETLSATIVRVADTITVSGTDAVDDLPNLSDTAIWKAAGGNEVCSCGYDHLVKKLGLDPALTHESVDGLMEELEGLLSDDYQEYDTTSLTLPAEGATYESILEAVDRVCEESDGNQGEMFKGMIERTKAWLEEKFPATT